MSNDQDESWGWDPIESEDDATDSPSQSPVPRDDSRKFEKTPQRNIDRKTSGSSFGAAASPGITSSPSFQELERAIGATLASSTSGGDLAEGERTGLPNRLSSTDLTQKKLEHQRNRNSYQNLNQYQHQLQHQQTAARGWMGSGNRFASIPIPARAELVPFINEEESRALVIFHSPTLAQATVADACVKFGVLYYIRPEFHHKGVTFVSFVDLQSASAAKESLSQLISQVDNDCSVHYSIMLHATNGNTEESRLVIKNLPHENSEQEIQTIVSRYGALRSIQKTFGSISSIGSIDRSSNIPATTTYTVEFFNIQDARLAASELSATSGTIWGPDIVVRFAQLDQRKQQLCKQLLNILSRWRSDMSSNAHAVLSLPSQVPYLTGLGPVFGGFNPYSDSFAPHWNAPVMHSNLGVSAVFPTPTYDGTFLMQSPGDMQSRLPKHFPYVVKDNNDHNQFVNPVVLSSGFDSTGYGPPVAEAPFAHSRGSRAVSEDRAALRKPVIGSTKLDDEYVLDVQKILRGDEKRTTIMVRNIPNKYTQQMLLEEVNAKMQGTYDFFYLPIDFKNRCNVGYGFINFTDPSQIPLFVKEFDGQKWANFNSEKVCAITFARIQGKTAMVSRFQNSSLLDKESEYKPLLFFTSGPNRGLPEPFPSNVNTRKIGVEDEPPVPGKGTPSVVVG